MEWQPIESAPRDGTTVIVYNAVTGPYVSACHGLDEWPMGFWGGNLGEWYPQPTHWMPLPEPPQ